ncbi:MAG TPA: hypothetical protein VJ743_15170 [Albitalea sp.]|nr:hypothetical protein [Albitalea sp.]
MSTQRISSPQAAAWGLSRTAARWGGAVPGLGSIDSAAGIGLVVVDASRRRIAATVDAGCAGSPRHLGAANMPFAAAF